MIEKHWHCSYCGDTIEPLFDATLMRIEYMKTHCILCPDCAKERKAGANTIDWARQTTSRHHS